MILVLHLWECNTPVWKKKCDEMVLFAVSCEKIFFLMEKVTQALRAYARHEVLRKIFVTIFKY